MKIYTKTGDAGETGLYSGERVAKSDRRIAVVGTLDELNAGLGLAHALAPATPVGALIEEVQRLIFDMGADVATIGEKTKVVRLGANHVARLEEIIDHLDGQLPPLRAFILPGGTTAAAQIHVCRAICRRAEREVVGLAEINRQVSIALNRLSDLLFMLARYQNQLAGVEDPTWTAA